MRDAPQTISRLLGHPLTRDLDLDSPETTSLRREIVKSKPFLRSVYQEWYELIAERIPAGEGLVLELGSGAGFLREVLPDVVTSDVFAVPGVDRVLDARRLPFGDGEVKAIVMTNVFHHIPDVERFLAEAQRTLRPGGRIIMVEPWNTPWSRFVHKHLHDEPMRPDAEEWGFPESGPLSGANAALAWIVVERDRDRLRGEYPDLRVLETESFMPFRYVVSGGVSLRSLQPAWMYSFWRWVDELQPIRKRFALFAFIVLERAR